jgi:hypothetical protein
MSAQLYQLAATGSLMPPLLAQMRNATVITTISSAGRVIGRVNAFLFAMSLAATLLQRR